MSVLKPTENWTKFPNCILDNLEDITGNELKVLALMIRKNIGYQSPNKKFSQRYIESKINMSRNTVIKSLDSLKEKKLIKEIGSAERGLKIYDILWNKPVVQKMHQSNNCTSSGSKNAPDMVQNIDQVKDNILKDNILKENISDISILNHKHIENKIHPDAILLSKNMLDKIIQVNNPTSYKKKLPDINKWAVDIDKMNRIDGYNFNIINNMIDWIYKNDFWSGVILSGNKLRLQASKIEIQMKRDNKGIKKDFDLKTYEETIGMG